MSWRDYSGRLGGGLTALGAGGLLTVVISWGLATASSQQTWPLWPYWLCVAILAAGAGLYAVAQSWIPGLRSAPRSDKLSAPARPTAKPNAIAASGQLPNPVSIAIIREIDYKSLRIVLTNKAAPDSFYSEITSITNEHGRSLAAFEEPWPIPWMDDPLGMAKRLETAGTARLNLATMTYSEPWEMRQRLWWQFQSPNGPVSIQSVDNRKVLVTVRITRAGSEDRISTTFELSTDIDNRPVITAPKSAD